MEDVLGATTEPIKPLLRPVRAYAEFAPFLVRSRLGLARGVWSAPEPPVFVIGCGRSGTTLLGELLGAHTHVYYLFEPRERWAAVNRATDTALAFSRTGARCFMDDGDAGPKARARFARVMTPPRSRMLVEKSPTNALRIGFLDALVDGARFVHIVRSGDDVARSIAHKASRTRRVVGRGMVNDWWGSEESKWRLLSSEGSAAGYYPDEVGLLENNLERAAYEWLVSLREVDRRRQQVGDRMHEVTYQELTEDPSAVLRDLAAFLGIDATERWLRRAAERVSATRRNGGAPLELPPGMAQDFNGFQRRYGFDGRAQPIDAGDARDATSPG